MKRFECKNCGHFTCRVFATELLKNKDFECKEKIFKTKWYEIDEEEEKTKVEETPSWCTIRSIVYHQNEYFTVIGEVGFTEVILSNGKQVSIHELAEARLRPFNKKEKCELLGKVVENKESKNVFLIHSVTDSKIGIGQVFINKEAFLKNYTFDDGSPCGVYEHLENGEWVQ